MKGLRSLDVKELAAIGAPIRLKELQDEIEMILDSFPALRQAHANGNGNGNGAAAAAPVKRRRHMSAKARRAIGAAQRKRWAALKEKEKGRSAKAASPK